MTYHTRYSPRFTNLPHDGKLFVPENSTFVIDVQSEDNKGSEQNGQLRYSIIGGVDAEFFKINERTGVLEFKHPPDFENDRSNFHRGDNIYDVKIQVKDAAHYTAHKTLWVMVTDVPENINKKPKFTNLPDDGILRIHENSTFVIDANASDDQDTEGNGLKYSIVGGVDAEFFDIDMATGELTFKNPPDFENDQSNFARGNNVYDVKIRVEDSHGAFCDKPLWIKVKDKPENGAIGDQVFLDTDRDGIQDAGEEGVAGVTVNLLGAGNDGVFGTDDDVADSTTTDADGLYQFSGLAAGDYKVTFSDLPDGFEFTTKDAPGSNFANDSDADPTTGMTDTFSLGEGQVIDTVDAGLIAPLDPASIGDTVFLDENRNGIQDLGEQGVEGVSVTIAGAGDDGVFGTDDDTEVIIITDVNGNYDSGDLAPGDYKVTFSGLPDGFEFTSSNIGPDDTIDSDAGLNGMTEVITLNAGENNTTVDAGIRKSFGTGSIGDKVFFDLDRDGIQDTDELGVEGVTVTLLGTGRLPEGVLQLAVSQQTDADGMYLFDALDTGPEWTYEVVFSDIPEGFNFSTPNVGDDDTVDSDADPISGRTDEIVLGDGENNLTVDAGIIAPVEPGSIGDTVFNDLNGDGIQDPDEPGIEGVTVTITGAGPDGVIGTDDDTETVVTTDENGNYNSGPLEPGDYKVTFSDLPDGFEFTTPNAGDDDALDSDANPDNGMTDVFTLEEGEDNNDVDAGLVDPVEPGSIGDTVFNDLDGDGIQDPDEPGIEGVTVTITGAGPDGVIGTDDDTETVVTTDENGNYNSGSLEPGDYKVTFSDLPDGFEFTTPNAGDDDALDSDANPDNGMTDVFTLEEGEDNNDVDAGLVDPVEPGSIGDTVFNDLDGDGIQDPDEPGIEGVTVTITGAGPDGVIGTDDDTETVVTTDENGNYNSGSLEPGDYKVTFSDLPDGFEFTTPNAGDDDALDSDANPDNGMTDVFTLEEGEDNDDVDAGLVDPVDPGSIGDTVFNDLDGDGIQDPDEPGIEGVTVTITGAGPDGVIGTDDDTETVVTTDENGNYNSGPLDPGDYKVTFSDLPDGFEFTTPNAGDDDALDSDANPDNGMTDVFTLEEGEDNNDVDAGLVDPVEPAHLGNRVFLDANGNGIQDRGERGVEGVTVTIDGAGPDGVFGTDDDTQVVTETNANGLYRSGELPPGDYKVTFSDLPDGFEFTTPNAGGDDRKDSDADPNTGMTDVITLEEGRSNNTVDAGLIAPVEPGSIGDSVFNDLDGDGIQDPDEPGIEGVTVTITGAGPDGVIGTDDDTETVVTTDENGNYNSGPLEPGDYKVTFSDLPDGFEFTTPNAGDDDALDSDANPANGMTDVFTLGEGEDKDDVDAGLVDPVEPAHLGNRVFLDANGNGIQDRGERGVEGVTVTIDGAGPDGVFGTDDDTQVVTETNANGLYRSGELPPGDYKVTFSDLPDGFEFTTPNAGGDDRKDSDADPNTGMTDVITLEEGRSNNTVDAGLIAPVEPGSIGDSVFNDLDGDGIQDPDEPGIEGVTVTITGAGPDGVIGTDDDTETVVTTDENGNYNSGPLDPGDYKVTFSDLPDGFEFTTPNAGDDDALDSDANPDNGMTDVFTLGEGEDKDDVDAGLVAPIEPARLGNRVFDDRNQNGIQDKGEFGVGGVTVTLTGGGEDGLLSTPDDNTEEVKVTRNRGNYFFNDLTPGTEYKVTFSDLPDGFEFTAQDQGDNDAKDSDADPTTGMTDVIILDPGEVNATVDAGIVFTLSPDKNFIRGTIAPDFLRGTVANDDIRGLGDSDTILGFEGDDCLFGNGGFDLIRGGSGADTINGGAQNDTLRGDEGNDLITGGIGNDLLFGGAGRDILDGTSGSGANEKDTLNGNGGADIYVLGDVISQYYVANGDNDFATINGFNASADTIQLNGIADDYQTEQNGNDLELLSNGELIAVFKNTSNLNINSVANFV